MDFMKWSDSNCFSLICDFTGAVYIDDMRLTGITARSTLSKLGEKNNIQRKNGSGTLFGKNSSGTMFGLRYLGLISTFIPSLLLASLW